MIKLKKYKEVNEFFFLNPVCCTCGTVIRKKDNIDNIIKFSQKKLDWQEILSNEKYDYTWCCRKHILEML